MSKKQANKVERTANKQFYKPELAQFDFVDVENICYASDEDLYGHLHTLVKVREDGVADGADAVPVEIEICYLRREIKVRADRREAHEKYVKDLQEENSGLVQAVIMSTPMEAN